MTQRLSYKHLFTGILACLYLVLGYASAQVSLPYNETFDSMAVGSTVLPSGWSQVTEGSLDTCSHGIINCFDWGAYSSATPSSGTGPNDDHTSPNNTATGRYLYVEASGNDNPTVQLRSPTFNLAGTSSPAMTFWVHRNNSGGVGSHRLLIDILNATGSATLASSVLVIDDSALDADAWTQQYVDLSAYAGLQVRVAFRWLEDDTGSVNWRPDIAIDDVEVSETVCSTSTAPAGMDVIFLLDNSGSVNTTEFGQMADLIRDTVDLLVTPGGNVRAAVVHYYSSTTTNHRIYIESDFSANPAAINNFVRRGTGSDFLAPTIAHITDALNGTPNSSIVSPQKTLNQQTGSQLAVIYVTDAARDYSSSRDGSWMVDQSNPTNPFGFMNTFKSTFSASVTTAHLASSGVNAHGAALSSVGGSYTSTVEANPGDPEGSGTIPRRIYTIANFASIPSSLARNIATTTCVPATIASYSVSGRLFEDVNYGGGAGRSYTAADSSAQASGFAAGSIGVSNATSAVELYDSNGIFIATTNTNAAGAYSFSGLNSGYYYARVVNARVKSQRPGGGASELAIQTFRHNGAAAISDEVGGRNPALADADVYNPVSPSTLNTSTFTFSGGSLAGQQAQSVSLLSVAGADLSGVDFGFNFDTIVNTNDSGQGSLRQFILNSNTLGNAGLAQDGHTTGNETSIFMLSDGNAHAGLRAGLGNQLSAAGVALIAPVTALPQLSDANTVIDGTTQTVNIGNSNSGQLGTGGTVGVDGLTLNRVERPEIEIVGQESLAKGLDINANNVTVRGLAIHGFGNMPNTHEFANIHLQATLSGAIIEQNIIGSPATSFTGAGTATATDPCAAARSQSDNIRATGADGGVVRNNLIGYASGKGIGLEQGSDNWLIENNEIRCNAITTPFLDGIDLESGSTNATVSANLIIHNEGNGVDGFNGGGAHTIVNNTITGNGIGPATATVPQETSGVRLFGNGSTVDRNIISANYGAGIMVVGNHLFPWATIPDAVNNTLTRNALFDNGTIVNKIAEPATGQIGIDLLATDASATVSSSHNSYRTGVAPFVTPNDNQDADTGGNTLLNFPVFEDATLDNGSLTLEGFAPAGSVLELFIADASPNPSPNPYSFDFGEGQTYLLSFTEGSATDTDTTSGNYANDAGAETGTQRFSFTLAVPSGVALGTRLTATATDSSGNTSEFGNVVAVREATNTVAGVVYFDADSDDMFTGTDTGLATISVAIYQDNADGIFDPRSDILMTTAVSGSSGSYSADLPNGTYWLAVDVHDSDLPADYVPGGPTALLVTLAGADVSGYNFPFEILANPFPPCDPLVYLFQNNPSDVFGIKLATGASQLLANNIGSGTRSIHANGLGYNVQDDFIYGSNSTDQDGTITRIDSNFQVTLLGPIPGLPQRSFYAGDVSPNGKLYFYNAQTGALHVIELDASTADYLALTTIPMSQKVSIDDLAFNPMDSQIYTVQNTDKRLYRINPVTGAVTDLGATGIDGTATFGAHYYDARGFLYVSKNQDGLIYRIDTSDPSSIDPTAIPFSNGPQSNHNDGAHCLYAQLPLDYGDAPFQTLLLDDGARHVIDPLGPYLGTSPDEESDGQPGVSSDGDDSDGLADEDGVSVNGVSLQNATIRAGETVTLEIATSGTGVLNAWIDFGRDGSFDSADQIATNLLPPAGGTVSLVVDVPDTVEPGVTYARFRFASEPLGATGAASDGEVEDYRIFLANIIISGTLFYDDGFGSGIPHDGIQNGNEQGIAGVTVTATDGTLTHTATTDTSGFYAFYTTPFGSNVTVSHALPRATGSSILGTSTAACLASSLNDTTAAAQLITDTDCSNVIDGSEAGFVDGLVYPGYDFGVVRDTRFNANQSGQSTSPGVIEYTHLFQPGTLGNVVFSSSGDYSYDLFIDADCDGNFATSEGPHSQPFTLSVGSSWSRLSNGALQACAVKLRVIVPDGEAAGTTDKVLVSADLTWLNTAITQSLSLTDTTVISNGGQLELSKEVCNVTAGCSSYALTGTGKPGDVLEYRIRFRNIGSDQVSEVKISDPVPFFTTLEPNQYGTAEIELTCPDNSVVQLETGTVSTVAVDVMTSCGISELQAGEAGTVVFRARIN